MNKDQWFLTVFYLAFGSVFLGTALQQVFLFLLLIGQVILAIPAGQFQMIKKRRGHLLVIGLLGATVLSALFFQIRVGFKGSTEFFWGLIAFWTLAQAQFLRIEWDKLFFVLSVCALLCFLAGLLQSFNITDLWGQSSRYGFFPSQRIFGESFCIWSCWCLAYLRQDIKPKRMIFWLLMIFCVGLYFYQDGNGKALIFLMSALVVFFLSMTMKPKIFFMLLPLWVLASIAAFWLVAAGPHFQSEWLNWTGKAWNVFLENPILGVSHGHLSQDAEAAYLPPNMWVGILAEVGLVGFLTMTCLLGFLLKNTKIHFAMGQEPEWVHWALLFQFILFFQFSLVHYSVANTSLLILYVYHWVFVSCEAYR